MHAYKFVVPYGAAPGDVFWVTVDPKTRTATGIPDDEVKATHLSQRNRLAGIVQPVPLSERIGPHEELWPDVVREIATHRYESARVRFLDYERNPRSFVTLGGAYRKDAVPADIVESSKIHYAAFFAPQGAGHATALRAFGAATEGWRRLAPVSTLHRAFHIRWIRADVCPAIHLPKQNADWMSWSESAILSPNPHGFCDVRSFCAPQASPFRISFRKDRDGTPAFVVITEDRLSLEAITVYPEEDNARELVLT